MYQKTPSYFATLLCGAILGGCNNPPTLVELQFGARFDSGPINCVPDGDGRALTDLRFFVHNVRLVTRSGDHVPVELTPDERWQSETVALVDLESGDGACVNGTKAENRAVKGTARLSSGDPIDGVLFALGVPSNQNHGNPLVAAAPLTYTVMHWHWRSGYKFMRAGIESATDGAWLHLGSARCAGTIGDIRGCDASNRPFVRLDDFDPAQDTIVVDVARLFGPTQLGDGMRFSCESGVSESHCRLVFAELGLDFATGEAIGSAPAFYREGS